jgi:hypothetical protein
MLREMDARELAEWEAYEKLEPFGEERADLRMAIMTANILNALRGKKGKKAKIKDFMPDFEKALGKKSGGDPEAMHDQWMGIVQMFEMASTPEGRQKLLEEQEG